MWRTVKRGELVWSSNRTCSERTPSTCTAHNLYLRPLPSLHPLPSCPQVHFRACREVCPCAPEQHVTPELLCPRKPGSIHGINVWQWFCLNHSWTVWDTTPSNPQLRQPPNCKLFPRVRSTREARGFPKRRPSQARHQVPLGCTGGWGEDLTLTTPGASFPFHLSFQPSFHQRSLSSVLVSRMPPPQLSATLCNKTTSLKLRAPTSNKN